MALPMDEDFDLARISNNCGTKQSWIDNCIVEHNVLRDIYNDYCNKNNYESLEKVEQEILTQLTQKLSGKVHSVRTRIKNPDHLIDKIIRNANTRTEKYSNICLDNYRKLITDLIGVRVIVLDKRDWLSVHETLLQAFRNIPERYADNWKELVLNYDKYADEFLDEKEWLQNSYHAERPVVYITSDKDRDVYIHPYLKIDSSKDHYSSIHYIIRYGKVYFEIQLRSLFEEGWLEFDHRVKYPNDKDNCKKQAYIDVINCLAVAADKMISFYDENDFLSDELQDEMETIDVDDVIESQKVVPSVCEEDALEQQTIIEF